MASRDECNALAVELSDARRSGSAAKISDVTGRLITANMGLVRSIAKSRARRYQLEVDDAFGYGIVGLIKAIGKFEPALGFQLSTYAAPWIRAEIEEGAEWGALIRKPAHNHERHIKILNARRVMTTELGRDPTTREVAESTGISMRDVKLDGDTSWMINGMDGTAADRVIDASERPDAALLRLEKRHVVDKMLSALTDREQVIVRARFADEPETLRQIGSKLGISRERVRQIEEAALARLRKRSERP